MNKKIMILFVIFIFIFLIFMQNKVFLYNKEDNNNRSNISSSWNLMIYISGDNFLSEMATKNLGLIKSVGSIEDVSILVLLDEEGYGNTRLGKIELRNFNETTLQELNTAYGNELNLGDNSTLENFVIWSMDNYPADQYALIIWGHGEEWNGVAMDGTDYLTMQELDIALNNIVEHNNGKKLDIIGFDACGMGMIEIMYQIQDYAKIAIASEKDIPERGWPYYYFLKPLTENPKMSHKELSELIVDAYVEEYKAGRIDNGGISVALSAIDLSKIDGIISNLNFIITDRRNMVFYEEDSCTDLLKYAQVNSLKDLEKAINASLIASDYWSNPDNPITCAYGISIYYPRKYDYNYDKLKFAQDTQWDEGIKSMYGLN